VVTPNQERGVTQLGIFLAAKLAAEVEVYYRSARIKSIATTHLYVAAGLAIKNGRWNELRQLIPRRDTVPGRAYIGEHEA
jgi:hypothetical protein